MEEIEVTQEQPDVPEQEPQEVVESVAEATEVVESKEPDETPQEIEVTIGNEPVQEERAPEWVRDLRRQHRELQRKVREYEAREQKAVPAIQAPGQKPKLDEFDYDTERYEAALEGWYKQKEQYENVQRAAQRQAEETQRDWQKKIDIYTKKKESLRVHDFEEFEAVVQDHLSVIQQGVIISAADNPALVVLALGKNPKKAKELAAITDPVKFCAAIVKMETEIMKVSHKKPPAPESRVPAGAFPVSGGSDATLERLREEAAKTGDMTKVHMYNQQLRKKAG